MLLVEQRTGVDHLASGLEDTVQLAQHPRRLGQMLHHLVEEYEVEARVLHRYLAQVADVRRLRIGLVHLLEVGGLVDCMCEQRSIRRHTRAGIEHECTSGYLCSELRVLQAQAIARGVESHHLLQISHRPSFD
jgi:hypothetical protein